MRPVFSLAQAFLWTSLREKESLFWLVIFPLLLFSLLSWIFGGLGGGQVELTLGAVSLDRGPLGPQLVQILAELVQEGPGHAQLFDLRGPLGEGDGVSFAEELRRAVREGTLSAAWIVPPGFSEGLARALLPGGAEGPPRVQVLWRRGEAASSMAAAFLEAMVQEFSREFLVQAGALPPEPRFSVRRSTVGGAVAKKYVDFIFPGVLIMAIFGTGLFSVPGAVLLARDTGVLRRYLVAPISLTQYFLSFLLGVLLLVLLQGGLLGGVARLGFGLSLALGDPGFFLYLGLATLVSLSIGFLASSLARTADGAFILANVANLPLQFLGGLYFPVTGLPAPLRVLVAINPLTHLAEGMRAALGVEGRAHPAWVGPLVIAIWVLLASGLCVGRLRLGVER